MYYLQKIAMCHQPKTAHLHSTIDSLIAYDLTKIAYALSTEDSYTTEDSLYDIYE